MRKILSLFVLFAMLVSIFVSDTEVLRTDIMTAEPIQALSAEETRPRVEILYNGMPVASTHNENIGRTFDSFVSGGTITLRAGRYNAEGVWVNDPNATIFFTTSSDYTAVRSSTNPAGADHRILDVQGGTANTNTRLLRHGGGVRPNTAPTATNPSREYTGPITVPAAGTTGAAFVVSAIARSGTRDSHVITRSFLLVNEASRLTDWRKEHGELMVFSIYSDARGIFDYDGGIFCLGKDRDDWIAAYRQNTNRTHQQILNELNDFATQGNYPPTLQANFTKRGRGAAERDAHVEMFTPNGRRQIAQSAGLRIKGGWSRGTYVLEQKTFEFYGRSDANAYSPPSSNEFTFPLFGEQHNIDPRETHRGNMQHSFRRFRVRNGGSDREQTYMRDEMASDLARMSGFPVPQTHRPAVVFLNGGYYGMTWIKSPRTELAWRNLYGGRENGFEHIGSNERGRASCGNIDCNRAVTGTRQGGTSGANFPVTCGSSPNSGGQGLNGTTGVQRCGLPDCSDYHSSFNSACATLGYCRGTGTNPDGAYVNPAGGTVSSSGIRPNNVVRGSWAEVVALVLNDPTTPGATTGNLAGLTVPANWARFQEIVDVDNMLHYYALQLFGANVDWPSNNMEMWRYYLNAEERADVLAGRSQLHPHLQDEKWRFIAQDLEMGWGIWQRGGNGTDAAPASATHEDNNSIHALLERTGGSGPVPVNAPGSSPALGVHRRHYNATSASFMMPAMLQRPEMRVKLGNAFADIIENSHSSAVSRPSRDRQRWFIQAEHSRMLHGDPSSDTRISELARNGSNPSQTANNWPTPTAIYDGEVTGSAATGHLVITNFLNNRPERMWRHIERDFNGTVSGSGNNGTGGRGLGLANTTAARNVSITASVSGPGHGTLNTRPFGMRSLPWAGGSGTAASPAVVDPRTHGRSDSTDHPSTTANITQRYWPHADAPIPVRATPIHGFRPVWTVTGIPNVRINNQTVAAGSIPAGTREIWIPATASTTATVAISFVRDPVFMAHGNLDIGTVKATSFNSQANDWIEIVNWTNRAVSTRGLYLTDSNSTDDKWQMPSFVIPPAVNEVPGRLRIRTSDNTELNAFLKRAQVNFNVGFGERLRLTKTNGELVNDLVRVEVSIMMSDEVQHRNIWSNGAFGIYPVGAGGAADTSGGTNNPGISFPVSHVPLEPCTSCQSLPCVCPCTPPTCMRIGPCMCNTCHQGQTTCTCPCPGGCGQTVSNCGCGPQPGQFQVSEGVTATNLNLGTSNQNGGINITAVPSGPWTVTINTGTATGFQHGSPWALPPGASASLSGGIMTITGNGTGGWGAPFNITWSLAGL
jgi:hypothetical protein